MTEIAKIRDDIAEAQARLDNLTTEAELALDRGGRGPSPAEIERARFALSHHQRRLELAREATGAPLTPAMRGVR